MTGKQLNCLAEAVRKREQSAFEDLYDGTYKILFVAVFSVLRDKMMTEDILHDTYLIVYDKIDTFKAGTNFLSWIITIAKRLALNKYARQKRETSVDFMSNDRLGGSYTKDFTESALFDLAKERLEAEEFEVLMMSAVCGYKRREIACLLEKPISTVSWIYKKAVEKMKNWIQTEEMYD